MTKYLLLFIIFFFLMPYNAFAGSTIQGSTTIGKLFFQMSNKVTIWAESQPTNGFVAYSWHNSGNRQFGTDSKESKIYWRDGSNLSTPSLSERISANFIWPGPWKPL